MKNLRLYLLKSKILNVQVIFFTHTHKSDLKEELSNFFFTSDLFHHFCWSSNCSFSPFLSSIILLLVVNVSLPCRLGVVPQPAEEHDGSLPVGAGGGRVDAEAAAAPHAPAAAPGPGPLQERDGRLHRPAGSQWHKQPPQPQRAHTGRWVSGDQTAVWGTVWCRGREPVALLMAASGSQTNVQLLKTMFR